MDGVPYDFIDFVAYQTSIESVVLFQHLENASWNTIGRIHNERSCSVFLDLFNNCNRLGYTKNKMCLYDFSSKELSKFSRINCINLTRLPFQFLTNPPEYDDLKLRRIEKWISTQQAKKLTLSGVISTVDKQLEFFWKQKVDTIVIWPYSKDMKALNFHLFENENLKKVEMKRHMGFVGIELVKTLVEAWRYGKEIQSWWNQGLALNQDLDLLDVGFEFDQSGELELNVKSEVTGRILCCCVV
ncbi:hypothetical protein L596_009915 [Steinernema carpocapsae]|uniref:Uncharacterized protein n=1 Tax=Steinernema carpocapsae TaxID=34508 RepID=A0A4U5PHJ2_STECR|nr:hypothetical protein L596_009915 [Steinernema carpocapsae]